MCDRFGAAAKKTFCSVCVQGHSSFYDRRIHRVRDMDSAGVRIWLQFEYRRVFCQRCQAVKQETLAWLASSGRFTKRFEEEIGRQCRELSIVRVAAKNRMSWDQVKRIEMDYMKDLLAKQPPLKELRAVGIDEVSITKGHSYATVVADLDRMVPICLGGTGRCGCF